MKTSIDFKAFMDPRGTLKAFDKIGGFNVSRFYCIECRQGEWRGDHYHRQTTQLIFVTDGCVEVMTSSATEEERVFQMGIGVMHQQKPGQKFKFRSLTPTSNLIVLCDREHDKEDYFTEFT